MQKSHFGDTISPLRPLCLSDSPSSTHLFFPAVFPWLSHSDKQNNTCSCQAEVFAAKQLPLSFIFCLSLTLLLSLFVSFSLIHTFLSSLFLSLSLHFSLCLPGAAFQRVCTECYLHHRVCPGHGRVLYANGFYWFTTDGKCDPYRSVCVCVFLSVLMHITS